MHRCTANIDVIFEAHKFTHYEYVEQHTLNLVHSRLFDKGKIEFKSVAMLVRDRTVRFAHKRSFHSTHTYTHAPLHKITHRLIFIDVLH